MTVVTPETETFRKKAKKEYIGITVSPPSPVTFSAAEKRASVLVPSAAQVRTYSKRKEIEYECQTFFNQARRLNLAR